GFFASAAAMLVNPKTTVPKTVTINASRRPIIRSYHARDAIVDQHDGTRPVCMDLPAHTPATKPYASIASSIHDGRAVISDSHCVIWRPWPGSKYSPSPEATSASTRAAGSFTTNRPCDSIAKILPSTLSAREPNLRRPPAI